MAYGYTIEAHKNDPLVELVGKAMDQFARAAVPGAFMVDVMPFRERQQWPPPDVDQIADNNQ